MFAKTAHRGLSARLTNRHGVHPGVAHLVALACYPKAGETPVEPIVTPPEAKQIAERWEATGGADIEQLAEDIFGADQLYWVEDYAKTVDAMSQIRRS